MNALVPFTSVPYAVAKTTEEMSDMSVLAIVDSSEALQQQLERAEQLIVQKTTAVQKQIHHLVEENLSIQAEIDHVVKEKHEIASRHQQEVNQLMAEITQRTLELQQAKVLTAQIDANHTALQNVVNHLNSPAGRIQRAFAYKRGY